METILEESLARTIEADGVLMTQEPGKMSGAVCIKGYRFPVTTLLDNLEDCSEIEDIYEIFELRSWLSVGEIEEIICRCDPFLAQKFQIS